MSISKERIKELERKEAKLLALENGGVDNWKFYDEALEEYSNTIELEKRIEQLSSEIETVLFEGAYEPAAKGAGWATTTECSEQALLLLKKGIGDIRKDFKLPKED
jgi:hypothetical protein